MSDYVSSTLMPGEEIAVSFHPHRIILANPIIIFLAALLFYGNVSHWLPHLNMVIYKSYTVSGLISLGFLLFSLYMLLERIVTYRTSEYTVTNRRVVMKLGIFTRRSFELMLNRLEAVSVEQTLFGQMFNYGTVTVIGVGGTRDMFTYVPKPMYFRQQVQLQRDTV